MKMLKKIGVFTIAFILLFSLMTVSVLAAAPSGDAAGGADTEAGEGIDMDLKPEGFSDRLGYAVQGTVTGILMVFSVLTLLCLILYGSKLVFYDIPNRKRERAIAQRNASVAQSQGEVVEESVPQPIAEPVKADDNGELVAVITAAVAAMIESEYKNEFVGGFRVVSFKRSEKTAWNRK